MSDNKPEAKQSTPGEQFNDSMKDLGARYIELGRAMQSGSATLEELVDLSDACGLRLSVGVTAGPQS
ncbi:MAG: hypothetical protein KAV87_41125 [Desulfobacteraceae bacterium]|nr:hypothetical protein [Desulfobacteraceae bacterium]